MANFLKKFKNLVLGKKDAKDLVGNLKELNKVTSSYLSVLEKQVQQKEKKVARIRVMVNEFLPKHLPGSESNLNIRLVDFGNTQVKQKGKGSRKEKMKWEAELKKFRRDNRGTII